MERSRKKVVLVMDDMDQGLQFASDALPPENYRVKTYQFNDRERAIPWVEENVQDADCLVVDLDLNAVRSLMPGIEFVLSLRKRFDIPVVGMVQTDPDNAATNCLKAFKIPVWIKYTRPLDFTLEGCVESAIELWRT